MFDRAEGYLGVMIDDLVTRGVTEPYRMFTSRAEYRLTLRADNADQRLTPTGIAIGCVGPERRRRFAAKLGRPRRGAASAPERSPSRRIEAERHGLNLNRDGQRRTAFELLSYPTVGIAEVARIWPEFAALDAKIAEQLEIDAKYAVYLERQAADVAAYRRDESLELPDDLDYAAMTALSWEVRQKLQSIRPRTIGQAGPHRRHDAGGADAAGGAHPAQGTRKAATERRVARGSRDGRMRKGARSHRSTSRPTARARSRW